MWGDCNFLPVFAPEMHALWGGQVVRVSLSLVGGFLARGVCILIKFRDP